MAEARLKAAVVGAGGWGYQHARAYFLREDTDLVAVVGRTEEKTRRRAAEFSTKPYFDITEMIEKEKPDLVSVCLPAQANFEATMEVIENGVPLLSEKPIAYKLEDARALVAAAKKQDLFYAIDFNQRYSIPCLMAKKALEQEKLGTPLYMSWRFGHGWESPTIDHPYLNLIEAQCHGLDMCEHFFGKIGALTAEMTNLSGKGSYTTFTLSLSFENGAVGTFLATLDADEHDRNSQYIELGGTKGRILIEDNVRHFSFHPNGSQTSTEWSAGFFEDDKKVFATNLDRHLNALIPALKRGDKPPVPAEKGLRALELGYAAIHSFENKTRVLV